VHISSLGPLVHVVDDADLPGRPLGKLLGLGGAARGQERHRQDHSDPGKPHHCCAQVAVDPSPRSCHPNARGPGLGTPAVVLEDLAAMLIFVTLLRPFINRGPVRCRSVECLAIGVLCMLLTGVCVQMIE